MRRVLLVLLLAACGSGEDPAPQDSGAAVGASAAGAREARHPTPATARLIVEVVQGGLGGEARAPAAPPGSFLRWRARSPRDVEGEDAAIAAMIAAGHLVEEPQDGAFGIEVPAGMAVDLAVFVGGQRGFVVADPIPAGGQRTVVVHLPPPARILTAQLYDEDGVPLDSMRVEAGDATTWSNPQGIFQVAVPVGARELTIRVAGWPPTRIGLAAEGDVEVEVHLEPGGELRLTLEDHLGRPARALAFLWCRDDPARHWTALADRDGLARATGLPTGEWLDLRVHGLPGAGAVERPGLPRLGDLFLEGEQGYRFEPGQVVERTLSLLPPGVIAGVVTDLDGRPLPAVELSLVTPAPGQALDATYLDRHLARARVVADAAGRFRFEEVPGGVWLVGVSRGVWNSRAPLDGRISPAALPATTGTEDVELRVAIGIALSGTVVDEGGVARARARLVARPQDFDGELDTLTRRDGGFELKGLMPGPHDLYLEGELVRSGVDPERQVPLTLVVPD